MDEPPESAAEETETAEPLRRMLDEEAAAAVRRCHRDAVAAPARGHRPVRISGDEPGRDRDGMRDRRGNDQVPAPSGAREAAARACPVPGQCPGRARGGDRGRGHDDEASGRVRRTATRNFATCSNSGMRPSCPTGSRSACSRVTAAARSVVAATGPRPLLPGFRRSCCSWPRARSRPAGLVLPLPKALPRLGSPVVIAAARTEAAPLRTSLAGFQPHGRGHRHRGHGEAP